MTTKCRVCANEINSFCKIKKIKIKINKKRKCEAYIFDESKVKTKQNVPVIKFGYKQQQEAKRRFKAQMKELRELRKLAAKGPGRGTARDLGLVKPDEESRIITPGDPRFSMPGNTKHPLTGDLSRFVTTASNKE